MSKRTDITPIAAALYMLPVKTRVPLKFGPEVLTSVTCARVRLTVACSADGRKAEGWGETPLSVQWVWPSSLSYEEREQALRQFCLKLVDAWAGCRLTGHPMEIGYDFQEQVLPVLWREFNQARAGAGKEPMPWLAALVCCSLFDIALHDAYGNLHGRPIYDMYGPEYMSRDLATMIEPASGAVGVAGVAGAGGATEAAGAAGAAGTTGAAVSFAGKYPEDYLIRPRLERLPAWHLVGGLDPLAEEELTGSEPDDGYPVLLADWIKRDGLKCLKVKLRGNDAKWDYQRLVSVGRIAVENRVDWLTTDFNCTVTDPAYVNDILDRLVVEHPRIYGMILYVEQPFPYDLENNRIDVHSVSARKPLFMDESAHDWHLVRLGRELGWTGVALKTCKTQTGALLTACWAKAHGMTLMVQDLTNPMLAQIPHVQLAAHVGTIMGVETNACQFYPEASKPEEEVHPGLYRRRQGVVDLTSLRGPGFGYRYEEIRRELPEPVAYSER